MAMENMPSYGLDSSHKNKISREEGEPVRAQPASTLEGVIDKKKPPQRVSEERKVQLAQLQGNIRQDATEELYTPLNHISA